MDGIVRRLKINELKSRILLCELERKSLQREIPSPRTTPKRRAWIFRRLERQDLEHREAMNDLKWIEAEARLGRPDPSRPLSKAL
jgi:hypothetical protein